MRELDKAVYTKLEVMRGLINAMFGQTGMLLLKDRTAMFFSEWQSLLSVADRLQIEMPCNEFQELLGHTIHLGIDHLRVHIDRATKGGIAHEAAAFDGNTVQHWLIRSDEAKWLHELHQVLLRDGSQHHAIGVPLPQLTLEQRISAAIGLSEVWLHFYMKYEDVSGELFLDDEVDSNKMLQTLVQNRHPHDPESQKMRIDEMKRWLKSPYV